MEVYEGSIPPPNKMELDLFASYSFDRPDLDIKPKNGNRNNESQVWHEARFGVHLVKDSNGSPVYGHIFTSCRGVIVQKHIATLVSRLAQSYEFDKAIATFIQEILLTCEDLLAECLTENASFLWRLVRHLRHIIGHDTCQS